MTKEHEVQEARIAWTNFLKNKIFKRASLAKYPTTALKLFRDFFSYEVFTHETFYWKIANTL